MLLAVFSSLFVKKNWRNLSFVGSFVIAYLGIIAMSGFSNSERFLLPGLPVLLLAAAYGITLLDAKNYRLIKTWPERLNDGTEIPYWRVLNTFGNVTGNQACTKKRQQERLTAEGHQIISAKHAKYSVLKVVDYQKKLFSFNHAGE